MTKDHQRQGMAELLAMQRSGPALTPSQAARQRRAREGQDTEPGAGTRPVVAAPESAGSAQQEITSPLRRALSRVAGYRSALLAAAGGAAVPLACWLAVSRWRRRS